MWGIKQKANHDIAHINTQLEQQIASYAPSIEKFLKEINAIVLDKQAQTRLALCCLIAGGHVLFEDLPGLGKTTLASSLSHLAGLKFQRIQFTNDMLASDVIGINMFNQKEHQFEFKQGPIFTQILLADEINRCSPKTQSALLEAMEEGYATVDGVRYALPKPFWVIATQNPLFQSGTYALPESQLDRFLMRLSLGYPSRHAEKLLLQQESRFALIATLAHVFREEQILELQRLVNQIYISEPIQEYLLDLAEETRKNRYGLSTRGLLALKRAAQAHALIENRAFVTPDDVQAVFVAVASHRLGLSEAETLNLMQQVAIS
ncbi:AAA family ATPase [Acinetobacter schindleri]|uniref:AAA family ATPase n=1 Tax=Acinetobacter TaxID=469 RepID=UPI000263E1EB|nr:MULTISPECIES: AAA family ATPase [Acinetobacter]APX62450.1 MoxR-like ATPase protein [Acinetobacter schindleri]EIM38605.1 methanol dehydrogenase regulatory protein [Acinetobacter sp. HA]MCK8639513.1 AAA family ATPase [Acinetobacter schindleri]MCO8066386.1 AAA family ATPase [Acinetobacter schindleri]MCU4323260.1 AAA family ATPase [Acinetobacter schindleri]